VGGGRREGRGGEEGPPGLIDQLSSSYFPRPCNPDFFYINPLVHLAAPGLADFSLYSTGRHRMDN
jgi:hypothetical protein